MQAPTPHALPLPAVEVADPVHAASADGSANTGNASVCPLCGQANACAEQAARIAGVPAQPCWCMVTGIPAEVLARVPAAARGRACICARCAAAPLAMP